jgi:hypothetical protein
MQLKIHQCFWCGTKLFVFLCTCGYYSCRDCENYEAESGCSHDKKEVIKSDWWVSDANTGINDGNWLP